MGLASLYDAYRRIRALELAGASGVADGDKGDVVVSGGGAVWTVEGLAALVSGLADAQADIANLETVNNDAWFGTGADGDVTLGAGTTTLARVMHYNNLTIPNGAVLNPNRFPFYVKGTLTIEAGGAITQNGGDAPGGTSATGGAAGGGTSTGTLLGVGQAGQNGGTQNVAAATAHTNQADEWPTTAKRGNAGGGGNTGSGATTAAQPSAPSSTVSSGSTYALQPHALGSFSHTTTKPNGGPGGGGGAGDNSSLTNGNGAGGGGGGGVIAFAANAVVNNGVIEAKGGAGGSKSGTTGTGRGTGGGAGGNGGRVYRLYRSWSGAAPDVSGGAGGTGAGTGSNGTDGSAGIVISWTL